jgi:transposase
MYVKGLPCCSARSLLSARPMVLNMQCDIENELRAVLREAGLKLRHARLEIVRLARQNACFADAAITDIVEPLLAILATMALELAPDKAGSGCRSC